jgi:hypothetical protein
MLIISDTINVIKRVIKNDIYQSRYEDETASSKIAKIMDFDNSITYQDKWSFN